MNLICSNSNTFYFDKVELVKYDWALKHGSCTHGRVTLRKKALICNTENMTTFTNKYVTFKLIERF